MSTQQTRGYSDARGARLSQWVALARYKALGAERFAAVKYRGFERIRARLTAHVGADLSGRDVLEVGCGQWRANVALLAAQGATIAAIDPEAAPERVTGYAAFALEVGLERALKTFANERLLRRRFEAELHRLAGVAPGPRPAAERASAEALPFADDSFDAVISDNVFEHLPDVPAATSEIARVLRPGGVAIIVVHPFTALSGGHHPATVCHGGGAEFVPPIPPWDHLRERKHDSGVFLNGWRPAAYLRAFGRHFETLEDTRLEEGAHLLTPSILAELEDYDRAELLTGKLVYVGRSSR